MKTSWTQPLHLLLTALLISCASNKNDALHHEQSAAMEATKPQQPTAGRAERRMGPVGPAVLIGSPAAVQKTSQALPTPAIDPQRGLLVAIDTPYEIFEGMGSYIHVAAWRTDGQPATGARVYVGDALMGTTDRHGAFVFIYPPPHMKDKTLLEQGEVTVVDDKDPTLQGAVPFYPNVRTASFASDQLYAYTDRGVYRPGERVHVRLIGWHLREDYGPLPDASVEVILRDPAGGAVAGGQVKTDADGIAAIDLTLPARAAEGIYILEVAHGQAREQARIQVRAFRPPVLRLVHDLGRFLTRDQRSLTFTVHAASQAGRPLKRAQIEVTFEVDGQRPVTLTHTLNAHNSHRFTLTAAQLDARMARASWPMSSRGCAI
jgi:hypothetical protein